MIGRGRYSRRPETGHIQGDQSCSLKSIWVSGLSSCSWIKVFIMNAWSVCNKPDHIHDLILEACLPRTSWTLWVSLFSEMCSPELQVLHQLRAQGKWRGSCHPWTIASFQGFAIQITRYEALCLNRILREQLELLLVYSLPAVYWHACQRCWIPLLAC